MLVGGKFAMIGEKRHTSVVPRHIELTHVLRAVLAD